MNVASHVGLAVAAYFLGAVPIGVLVARSRGVDILSTGSGNPGATNVWRTCGPAYGMLVFVLDIGKGLIPALIARQISPYQEVWFGMGFVAVIGHSLSPFLKFKGGKGVATALGASIGACPWVALIGFVTFMLCVLVTSYVSLSSIAAVTAAAVSSALLPGHSRWLAIAFGVLWVLVVLRHRDNIVRLRAGTERKFSFRGSRSKPDESNREEQGGEGRV